jgi:phage repressor protein C with HTH and peptisase S24 domain
MALKKKRKSRELPTRYKNKAFQLALGVHCRRLRTQKGYSIDRMSKEGDKLSPAAIQRLETGTADVQVSLLHRYSQVLGLTVQDLLDFEYPLDEAVEILPYNAEAKKPDNAVPLYSIEVAAGRFSKTSSEVLEPEGWVVLADKSDISKDYFAARVSGASMEPMIPSGSLCLFKRYTGGSRNGQIMLIQAQGVVDPDTGGRFVLKKYKRITKVGENKGREGVVVHLLSNNPDYPLIVLKASSEEEISTPALFIRVLGRA